MTKRVALKIMSFLAAVIPVMVTCIFSACSVKNVPVNPHDPAPSDSAPTEKIPHSDPRSTSVNELRKLDFGALEDRATTNVVPELDGIIRLIEPFILNPDYLDDPQVVRSEEFRRALAIFNQTLLALTKHSPASSELTSILNNYYDTVASGCDDELKGCRYIETFRTDPGSAGILKSLARSAADGIHHFVKKSAERRARTRLYYRYLEIAFDLKNSQRDRDLELLYLRHSVDYMDYFASLIDREKAERGQQRHLRVKAHILNDLDRNHKND